MKSKFYLTWLVVCIGLFGLQARADPYLLHASGAMVLDKKTGLVWMRCALGEDLKGDVCAGKAHELTFDQAQRATAVLNATGGFQGHTDWVIPKLRQLHSLVNCFNALMVPNPSAPSVLDNEIVVAIKLKQLCRDRVPMRHLHPIAFPSKSLNDSYWSSSFADPFTLWGVDFGNGAVGKDYSGQYYLTRLVRVTPLSGNEADAGFTMQLASGIEVFNANQKTKQ